MTMENIRGIPQLLENRGIPRANCVPWERGICNEAYKLLFILQSELVSKNVFLYYIVLATVPNSSIVVLLLMCIMI